MSRVRRNSGKDPSFQFYWKDWMSDTKLALLTLAQKGVWIDLICLSMDMPVRGVFHNGQKPLTQRQLVTLQSTRNGHETDTQWTRNRRETNRAINRLLTNGILRQFTEGEYAGSFYVKRIYEDMKLRDIRREAGKKGGNPNLVNQQDKQSVNQKPTPSSSSSSSYPYTPLTKCLRCGGGSVVKTATDDTGAPYGLCGNCIKPESPTSSNGEVEPAADPG